MVLGRLLRFAGPRTSLSHPSADQSIVRDRKVVRNAARLNPRPSFGGAEAARYTLRRQFVESLCDSDGPTVSSAREITQAHESAGNPRHL